MTLDQLETALWRQARNLNSADTLTRRTAMDVILVAISGYAETQAGPIVARRRGAASGRARSGPATHRRRNVG